MHFIIEVEKSYSKNTEVPKKKLTDLLVTLHVLMTHNSKMVAAVIGKKYVDPNDFLLDTKQIDCTTLLGHVSSTPKIWAGEECKGMAFIFFVKD